MARIQTVLFVHGTGVRKATYDEAFVRLQGGLKVNAPHVKAERCLWGDHLGARLGKDGVSIPDFEGAQSATPNERQILALWDLLTRDPMFELRDLAIALADELIPPAEQERKKTFVAKLKELATDGPLLASLGDALSEAQWKAAVDAVAADPALPKAVTATARVDTRLRLAAAHAVVATALGPSADGTTPSLAATRRDELVDKCVDRLGGRELGVQDWIGDRLLGLGLRWATNKAKREREALYSVSYPAAGDILLYQARGQAIRDCIARRVRECGPGTAILAHSLGGIASVDTLVQQALPEVELLFTFGSQAPFLYEIGALSQLSFGEPLPAYFPKRWLNVYDPNDLLSYRAATVFTGYAEDRRVASGQPFPHSHSAYWDQPDFWQALGEALLA